MDIFQKPIEKSSHDEECLRMKYVDTNKEPVHEQILCEHFPQINYNNEL